MTASTDQDATAETSSLRSALTDRAIFGAGLVAMAASLQLMAADAPPITVDPTPKLPIVIDPPANFPQPCSFVPVGGHNLLEPAALGRAVLSGPYYSNSEDIAKLLIARGVLEVVHDAPQLAARLGELLSD